MAELGASIPLPELPLSQHRAAIAKLRQAGFSGCWTGEVNGLDGLNPLAMVAAWEPTLTVGCGVVPVFTRTPALLAQTAAALGEMAPGRSFFGMGSGSSITIQQWNGISFEKPFTRVKETLRFVRECLTHGAPVTRATTFQSEGFRLERQPQIAPRLLLGALGQRMQNLAAAEADGVILNFLGPSDVETVLRGTSKVERIPSSRLEVITRVFVVPGSSAASELQARRHLAAYLNVPVYAEFQKYLGRDAGLQAMRSAWQLGDRAAAVARIPDQIVADLVVTGSPADCASALTAYGRNGVDITIVSLMPPFGKHLGLDEHLDFLTAVSTEYHRMKMCRKQEG
jgi:probable F420-dependent oxidoreductase